MTWQAVARKDFQDSIRSRSFWLLSVLSILLFAGAAVLRLYAGGAGGSQQGADLLRVFLFFLKEGTAIVVPLTAIVVGYASLTRERESGTMKLLLALPHSRDDVVVGKLLGRSAVIAVPILIGLLVALAALIPVASGFSFVTYLLFALLTALLGVVFVGMSVGVSAAAETNQQAVVGAGGLFAAFWFLWNLFVNGVTRALTDVLGLEVAAQYRIRLVLKLLNPIQAYKTLVTSLFASELQARVAMFGQLFGLFVDPNAGRALGPNLPFVFTDPFVLLFLLLWLVVPVAVGLVWFRDKDL